MSWHTNTAVIFARNIGRRLGLNALLGRMLSGRGYEERFGDAMLASIKPGVVVWDIGANVGLYSKAFAQRAGSGGHVYAFEPSPTNLERLRREIASLPNVTVIATALGRDSGTASFEQGGDELGATSRVVESTRARATVTVPIAKADDLVAHGAVVVPAVVKIDTEGFELDVLEGMQATLRSPALRTLCIEVHFALLAERGMADAPSRIERMLRDAGFDVSWPDASHIIAVRA